jgi:hypothetical protein
MVPEENLVFDPGESLRELVGWTHYLPGGWKGRLHSQAVSSRLCERSAIFYWSDTRRANKEFVGTCALSDVPL